MLSSVDGRFLVGDALTLADIAIYCEYRDVDYLGCFETANENVMAWVEACEKTLGLGEVHNEGSAFADEKLATI